ncbi:hypothetical protein [Symbioplanes lichenis]|uniref:hypothetical protein n=1 Tax=Symbioplanes lichenis TaxID=1629072 RepID=UPI0027390291|nr:hypothetical protein [Actinoplanes lichenis]
MQRIEVTRNGITVTSVTEPMLSAFGKEMRPATTAVDELAWEDILRVSLSAGEFAPADPRLALLTVDTTWGEFLEVTADAQGFTSALRELCARSGIAVPDLRTLTATGVEIWRIPDAPSGIDL